MALGSSVDIVKLINEKQLKEWAGWKRFAMGKCSLSVALSKKYPLMKTLSLGSSTWVHAACAAGLKSSKMDWWKIIAPAEIIKNEVNLFSFSRYGPKPAKGEIKEATEPVMWNVLNAWYAVRSTRIRRARKSTPGALHASLRILLSADWKEEVAQHALHFSVVLEADKKRLPVDEIMPDQAVYLNRADSELINKLEEIGGGGIKKRMEVSMAQWVEILVHISSDTIQVGKKGVTLALNKKVIDTEAEMDLDRETGELIVRVIMPEFVEKNPIYFLGEERGYLVSKSKIYALNSILPRPLREAYRQPVR